MDDGFPVTACCLGLQSDVTTSCSLADKLSLPLIDRLAAKVSFMRSTS